MTESLDSTTLNLLKCSLCHNFLSYFPIFSSEGKNICGRCPVGDDAVRNDVYEVIAKLHYFPCRYQNDGCSKELIPEDMAEHEETCLARGVKCPVSDCLWDDSLSCLIDHCEEEHPQLMLKRNQNFDVNLEYSYEVHKFFVYDNKLFIVSLEFDVDRKRLECLITDYRQQNQSETSYFCLLTLKFAKRSCATEFSIDSITKLLYIEMLENLVETTKITAFLQIGQTHQEIRYLKETETLLKHLLTLQCTSCCTSLFSSIYSNSNGLFYCSLCSAEKSFFSSNDSLSNSLDSIEIFCKYQKNGCTFEAFASVMKEHEEVCKFKIIKCVFSSCEWEDQSKSMIAHVRELHESRITQRNNFTTSFLVNAKSNEFRFRVFTFKKYVFRFVAVLHKEEYIFSVQAVTGNPQYFKYEVCAEDKNVFKDRVIMRKTCSKFESFESVDFSRNNNYCYLPEKHVKLFLFKNEDGSENLSFRVTVFNNH